MCLLRLISFSSPASLPLLAVVLFVLNGMTPELASMGERNGFWKYCAVAIRIF